VDPAEADPGGDLVHAAVGDDLAVGDHHHAGGQGLRLLQVVGGQQHGAAVGHKGPQHLPQPVAGLHVQAGGRLVQHRQAGVLGEGQRHRQPTGLAAGEAAGAPAGHLRQAELVKQLPRWCGVRVVDPDQVDHLPDGEVVGEPALLEGDPDRAAGRGPGRVAAKQPGRPGVGAALAEQDADRGGLAGSVGAQQRHQLTRMELEVDAAQGLDLPVAFVDPLQLCDGLGVPGVIRHLVAP
jgi:hypothetical protein